MIKEITVLKKNVYTNNFEISTNGITTYKNDEVIDFPIFSFYVPIQAVCMICTAISQDHEYTY